MCDSSYQFVQDAPTVCCPSEKECAQTVFQNTYDQEVEGEVADCPTHLQDLISAQSSVLNVPSADIGATCPTTRRRTLTSYSVGYKVSSENEATAFAIKDTISADDFSSKVNGALSAAGVTGVSAGETTYGSVSRDDGAESVTYSFTSTDWSSECDTATCGSELAKSRTVNCVSSHTPPTTVVDSYCAGTKPVSEENCGFADCVEPTTTQGSDGLETSASSLCIFLGFLFMIFNY